jgi:hypothetical protein
MSSSVTFVGQYDLLDGDYCRLLIDEFRNSPRRSRYLGHLPGEIPPDLKECWQVTYYADQELGLHRRMFEGLQTALDRYIAEYEYARRPMTFGLYPAYHLQHYEPGMAFHSFHSERGAGDEIYRHLVWMVYLNDVTDEGGTEFYYQNLVTEPRAGRILIWPSDWTHTHRGIPSPTQDKYIVTGWLSFLPA